MTDVHTPRLATHGYVLARAFVAAAEVEALRVAVEVSRERDPSPNPLSLGEMRFKSNLFYDSDPLRRFLCSPQVIELLTEHVGPDLWVRWDQAVWKHPGAPTFPWHQDNGYTGLSAEHFQLWLALTPMDSTNGGLVIAPGRHRQTFAHTRVGGHVEMDPPDTPLTIEAVPGDAVLFSSRLPHMTGPNLTAGARLAYVAEFLPLNRSDSTVTPPHFVICEHGRATGHFTDLSERWRTTR